MVEDLIKKLREPYSVERGVAYLNPRDLEIADALEQQAARITALESERDALVNSVAARGKEAVAWQVRRADGRIDSVPIQWENCTQELYDATLATGRYAGYENGPRCEVRALYTAPTAALENGDGRDAERYRWLRDTLHGAKAGGGVEVNDALQVYEKPEPGKEVRVYWYQNTPVGFYESEASTLDEAIDAALSQQKAES